MPRARAPRHQGAKLISLKVNPPTHALVARASYAAEIAQSAVAAVALELSWQHEHEFMALLAERRAAYSSGTSFSSNVVETDSIDENDDHNGVVNC